MGITGFDRLLVINTISTERKLYKTKVNLINGKNTNSVVSQGDNAQIKANMTVVHNILNGGIKVSKSEDFIVGELELAA